MFTLTFNSVLVSHSNPDSGGMITRSFNCILDLKKAAKLNVNLIMSVTGQWSRHTASLG